MDEPYPRPNRLLGMLTSFPEIVEDWIADWLTASGRFHIGGYEMNAIHKGSLILAGIHLVESVVALAVDKHAAGEHVTYGDVANVIGQGAIDSVNNAGIADEEWRPAPAKRGRKAAELADK